MMFKILEFKGVGSAQATEVGHRYSTRQEATAAVKTHLKKFKASGRNPEGDYWWARDARRPAKMLDFHDRLKDSGADA